MSLAPVLPARTVCPVLDVAVTYLAEAWHVAHWLHHDAPTEPRRLARVEARRAWQAAWRASRGV